MLYPVIIIALLPLKWVLDKYFYSHDEIEAVSVGVVSSTLYTVKNDVWF